jgi:hypothetical protein
MAFLYVHVGGTVPSAITSGACLLGIRLSPSSYSSCNPPGTDSLHRSAYVLKRADGNSRAILCPVVVG